MSAGLPKMLDGRTVAPLPEEYRMAAKVGDIVRTPWGIIGIVKDVFICDAGCYKEVTVLPFSAVLQVLTLFGALLRYGEGRINTLTLLHKAERD